MGVYFCGPQECGELRPAACELRLFHESRIQGIITTSKTGGLLRPYKGLTPVVAL